MTKRNGESDKTIGANLRRIRVMRELTQTDIADALGVTYQQVQKYETGANAIVATYIPPLCELLRIGPADLFAGTIASGKREPVKSFDPWALKQAGELQKLSPTARAAMGRIIAVMSRVP